MKNNSEPREPKQFWINSYKEHYPHWHVYHSKEEADESQSPHKREAIHVIEYSALLEAEAIAKANIGIVLKLQAENTRLRKALEEIEAEGRRGNILSEVSIPEMIAIAKAALEARSGE